MKKNLKEEIKRMHSLNYGSLVKEENFFQKLLNKLKTHKKIDDPKKADYLSGDVDEFYNILEYAANSGGISQQKSGNYSYQVTVEALQIALQILGYQLPKFGVDGIFGPETANAVKEFKNDNSLLNEETSDIEMAVSATGNRIKGNELESGGPLNDNLDNVVAQILKDFEQTNPNVKITLTSGNDLFHKKLPYTSQHTLGSALDLTLEPNDRKTKKAFENLLEKYKSKVPNFKYINEYDKPTRYATGGHFHLEISSTKKNKIGADIASDIVADKETFLKIIELLKSKNITPEVLKNFIDKSTSGVISKIDLNNFQTISDQIIDKLEGGYYHPSMSRIGGGFGLYDKSGETMMGIDRMAGGQLNDTPEMVEFWKLIDNATNNQKWPWNYKGGPLEKKLRNLVANVMRKEFAKLANRYLTSEAKNVVLSDKRLLFNFVYATWNGPGWFKKFADDINKEVEAGNNNPSDLIKVAINSRLTSNNEIIKKTGDKLNQILIS